MPLLTSTRNTRHLGIDFRKFPVKTNKKLSVKNLQNWIFVKNGNFLAKKIHDFEFSKEYHYSHTLEDKQVKTLGSFQPKLMKKIEVLSQKPSKTGFLPKNDHFFYTFWPKNPQFLIFPRIPLLAHASRYLGEDIRKFSAKTNDKN